MLYYVKFTIKDNETKEERTRESNKYEDLKQAQYVMLNYLKKQIDKSLNIEMLGNNKAIVEKFGGNIFVEVLKEI